MKRIGSEQKGKDQSDLGISSSVPSGLGDLDNPTIALQGNKNHRSHCLAAHAKSAGLEARKSRAEQMPTKRLANDPNVPRQPCTWTAAYLIHSCADDAVSALVHVSRVPSVRVRCSSVKGTKCRALIIGRQRGQWFPRCAETVLRLVVWRR